MTRLGSDKGVLDACSMRRTHSLRSRSSFPRTSKDFVGVDPRPSKGNGKLASTGSSWHEAFLPDHIRAALLRSCPALRAYPFPKEEPATSLSYFGD